MHRRDFLASFFAAAAAPARAAGALRAGFAETDITPEIGMEQPGGYGKVFHKALHDACKVRAAVFDDGQKTVALVGADALVMPRRTVLAARQAIAARTGIAPEAILLNASHSHSSGPVGMVLPGEYDHASPLVQRLAYEKSSAADPKYLAMFEKQIVSAVCLAHARREELACAIGRGVEDQAAFNRRFRMANGLTYTHPGQGNPGIVQPAGPIDPDVGVVGAWTAGGRLVGCVVHYACHATTNPGGISANWIYHLEQTVRGVFGAQTVVVFLQGACGDIMQVDNLNPYQQPTGAEFARRVGGRIGAEAVKVLYSALPGQITPVNHALKALRIARRAPSAERVRQSLELVQRDPRQVGVTEWTFAKEIVMLDALLAKERSVEVEVQAVQVGPAVFLANPAEYFVEFGLDIKRRSPFPFTFPVELSNGCAGYVPTEEALGAAGGGYETRLTSYSNLEASAGRQIADASVALAWALKPGRLPVPPPAPAFAAPWSYGSVPPEVR